jgi:predicted DNA-binding transcriptional regulator YafY
VARRGDSQLSRAAVDTVAKIGTVLPVGLKPFLYDASLLVPNHRVLPDAIDVSLFRAAIREGRKVSLHYKTEEQVESQRIIWPIAIAYYDASRIVVAWCELRQDFRSFRTDRMVSAEELKERYPARRAKLLKQWSEMMRTAEGVEMADVFA